MRTSHFAHKNEMNNRRFNSKQRMKKVQFDDSPDIHFVERVCDMSWREVEDTWLSKYDFMMIESRLRETLQWIKAGRVHEEICGRGLGTMIDENLHFVSSTISFLLTLQFPPNLLRYRIPNKGRKNGTRRKQKPRSSYCIG